MEQMGVLCPDTQTSEWQTYIMTCLMLSPGFRSSTLSRFFCLGTLEAEQCSGMKRNKQWLDRRSWLCLHRLCLYRRGDDAFDTDYTPAEARLLLPYVIGLSGEFNNTSVALAATNLFTVSPLWPLILILHTFCDPLLSAAVYGATQYCHLGATAEPYLHS